MREGERDGLDTRYNQRVEDRWVIKEIRAGRVFLCIGEERCDGVMKCSTETAEGKQQGGALCVCTPPQCVCTYMHMECVYAARESVCVCVCAC